MRECDLFLLEAWRAETAEDEAIQAVSVWKRSGLRVPFLHLQLYQLGLVSGRGLDAPGAR